VQHTKQHQERGVHCDLQVQRLASSSAINYLNGRNVPFCQAVKNGMMKEKIVAVVAENLCLHRCMILLKS
jgi:hypothetical protein